MVVPVSKERMRKALNTSRLVKKEVTVHRGGKTFQQMRWLRPDQVAAAQKQAAPIEQKKPRASAPVENTRPRVKKDDPVSFKANGNTIQGKVIDDSHNEGVVVETSAGEKFNVRWQDMVDKKEEKGGVKDFLGGNVQAQVAWMLDSSRTDNSKKVNKDLLVQPSGNLDELYKLAEEGREGFRKFMEQAKEALGAKKLMSRPVLKSKERILEKMKEDGAPDARQIYDIDGHTLIFDDLGGVARGLKYFMDQGAAIRIKNNFANVMSPAGYRDININIKLPNGMISEIQINTEAMMEAKEQVGHVFYEVMREALGALPPPPPPAGYEEVLEAQKAVYNFAWDVSRGQRVEANLKASLLSIAWPLWNKSANKLEGRGSSWLSDKTKKRFMDFGSQANGTSSLSKNSSPSVAKSIFAMLFPPRSKYSRGSKI